MEPETPSFRVRARRFWQRHRTLFWMVHSVWALATGIAVVVLAHERYQFVPFVLAFLGVTWLSTLFFGGKPESGQMSEQPESTGASGPTLRVELTSYVTRTLYQETLFFLIPFYAYSTVVASPNVAFLAVLVVLAVLSCIDLLFDRLLRGSAVFGLLFFASVAYAAVNLILPMISGIDPETANPIAAAVAIASALPLALRAAPSTGKRLRVGLAAVAIVALPVAVPILVPPVPLRLARASFGPEIDRETLELRGSLGRRIASSSMNGAMIVVVEVFAPGSVPASVSLEWRRNGERFREHDEVEILAHEAGFRIWDGWRPEPGESVAPGRYTVTLRTSSGRVFGVAALDVV